MTSCNRCCEWNYREVVASCDLYHSAQLTHSPSNTFTGVELQFLRGTFGTLVYLNSLCRDIPSHPQHPSASSVMVTSEETKQSFLAVRMEGRQRLLLPEEARDLIISSLLKCQTVEIRLDGFCTLIEPSTFPKLYQKFSLAK